MAQARQSPPEETTQDRLRSMILTRANVTRIVAELAEAVLQRTHARGYNSLAVPRLTQLIEQGRTVAHPHDAPIFTRLHELIVAINDLPVAAPGANPGRRIQTVFTPLTPFTSIDSDSDSEVKTPTLWDRLETED
jgi:hypothetical protein